MYPNSEAISPNKPHLTIFLCSFYSSIPITEEFQYEKLLILQIGSGSGSSSRSRSRNILQTFCVPFLRLSFLKEFGTKLQNWEQRFKARNRTTYGEIRNNTFRMGNKTFQILYKTKQSFKIGYKSDKMKNFPKKFLFKACPWLDYCMYNKS